MQEILCLLCCFFICWLLFQQELYPSSLKEELKNYLILGSLAIYTIFFNLNQFYHFCKLPEFLIGVGMLLTVSMCPIFLLFLWEVWLHLTKTKEAHNNFHSKTENRLPTDTTDYNQQPVKPQKTIQTTPLFAYTAKMEKLPAKRTKKTKKRRKLSKTESRHLGLMYEKFIGARLESGGYIVDYNGINKGKADGGVDLVASKDDKKIFIQCKYWSFKSVIHEDVIFQLYGAVENERQKNNTDCEGILYCSCSVDEEAKNYDFRKC